MVQKRGTKAINKLCVREILGLSFVCGAYFLKFRGWKQGRYACALPFSRVPAGPIPSPGVLCFATPAGEFSNTKLNWSLLKGLTGSVVNKSF